MFFASNARRVSIRLMMDNMTAVNYVNKSGGTNSSQLDDISSLISLWFESGLIREAQRLRDALGISKTDAPFL